MFDVNESIAGWRNGLATNENYSTADLDELESHIREQVDALRESGLSDEESFWLAARRLGDGESLTDEFAKVNGGRVWANRLLWMMGGILVCLLASSLAGAAWWGTVFAGATLGLSGSILGAAGVIAKTLAWILSVGIVCALGSFVAARSSRKPGGRKALFPVLAGAVLVVVLGATAVSVLSPTAAVRLMDISTIQDVALIGAYAGVAWSVVAPMIFIAAIYLLWRKQAREQHA